MNETLKSIHNLHSERQFNSRPIPQEDLETILEAAVRTANSSSRQAYSVIVLTDKEKMKAACGYTGAALLIFCVDQNRLMDIADYMQQDYKRSATIDFITGGTDAVLAAQTATIAAASLGIASLITNGVHRQNFDALYELLHLPKEYCFPMIGVLLGYSANPEAKHFKGRMTKGVIHYDTYHHLTKEEIEEEIAAFDSREGKYGLTSYTQWEGMGFKHYYEWFYQVWNGEQEDIFYPVLKGTKFFQ